jgi:hypothetical protein
VVRRRWMARSTGFRRRWEARSAGGDKEVKGKVSRLYVRWEARITGFRGKGWEARSADFT